MRYYIAAFAFALVAGIVIHEFRQRSLYDAQREAIHREFITTKEQLAEYSALSTSLTDCQYRYLKAVIAIGGSTMNRHVTADQDASNLREYLAARDSLSEAEGHRPRIAELEELLQLKNAELSKMGRELSEKVEAAKSYMKQLSID